MPVRGVTIFINADEKGPLLLVDPERIADLAGGLEMGVGGLYAAQRAKLPLYRSLGAGESVDPCLIALEDVHELVATYKVETAKDRFTRNRFQKYLDARKAARRARGEELGRLEKEREAAVEQALARGMHADFLGQKQKAEAVKAARNPIAPAFDLDMNAWQEAGAPEVVTVPPAPVPDFISDDEGEVLR